MRILNASLRLSLALALGLTAAACGGGNGTPDAGLDAALPDAVPPDAPPIPPFPTLGTQVDRLGRPLVSDALVAAFVADQNTRDTAKNDYNAKAPADWAAQASVLASSLAVWDGLDQTCGNQLMAKGTVTADRYSPLATLLADDALYVDGTKTTCTTYLAVETGANDCGGRTPAMDVIDDTYTALVSGGATAVDDGVTGDPDGTVDPNTFPFLLAPQ